MPLADVLAAFRTLILDDPPTGGNADARGAEFRERFKDLTADERADLAAIPPERLGVYTHLIFSGERAVLQWVFPMSLAVVTPRLIESGAGATVREAQLALVRDLHRVRPWKSASHRDLARNFEAYLVHDRADLAGVWLGLANLLDFERTELEVLYHSDSLAETIAPPTLATMSVGELMAQPIVRPGYVALREYAYDLIALANHWRREQTLPRPLPAEMSICAVCGRNAELMPMWQAVSAPLLAGLAAIEPETPATINDLAQVFVTHAADTFSDETEAFGAFFTEFVSLLHVGAVLQPR